MFRKYDSVKIMGFYQTKIGWIYKLNMYALGEQDRAPIMEVCFDNLFCFSLYV